MKRALGWLGLLLAALAGAAITFAGVYLFAPHAPSLVLLILVPLIVGVIVAAVLARWPARRAGVSRRAAAIGAGVVAALPLTGLLTALLLSPELPHAPPGPDPRGLHRTLVTPTGARIAWWRIDAPTRRHSVPVVFLAGGPGTFARNRDMAIGAAFRDAGFDTIFYDQAGSGASSNVPVQRYTVASAVADLDALRAATGAKQIVPWGSSWGASLAAAYTRAHPDRVAAAIYESPGDFPGQPLPLDYSGTDTDGGFQPKLRNAALYLLIQNAPHLAESWATQDDARAEQQARTNKITRMYSFQCKGDPTPLMRPLSPPGGSLYPQVMLLQNLARQPRISGVLSTAPALVIRGNCDFIPPGTAQLYMRALPNAQRVDVPGRGHALFGHDDELAAILSRYAKGPLAQLP